jgi:hypothetical protein
MPCGAPHAAPAHTTRPAAVPAHVSALAARARVTRAPALRHAGQSGGVCLHALWWAQLLQLNAERVFSALWASDHSMAVSAPTGSGNMVCFELAICRMLAAAGCVSASSPARARATRRRRRARRRGAAPAAAALQQPLQLPWLHLLARAVVAAAAARQRRHRRPRHQHAAHAVLLVPFRVHQPVVRRRAHLNVVARQRVDDLVVLAQPLSLLRHGRLEVGE